MQADSVLYNGQIHTQYDKQAISSALAIRDGRVLALGDDAAMRDLLMPGGEAIDLGGRWVIPGLTDAHVHLAWYASALQSANLVGASSAQEAVERVAAQAARTPPGEWVGGFGWAQDDWAERAFPIASQLDARVPDHPVCLRAHSGHAIWVNSAALRIAGIDASTPDPEGGKIGRDESGEPSGVLYETAIDLVTEAIPPPDVEKIAAQVKAAMARAHQGGLTCVHDFDGVLAFRAYQTLRERGELSLRIVKNLPLDILDHALETGLQGGFGDDFLRIGGVKLFADGALGPRTAWMLEPYEGESNNTGICTAEPEEMREQVSRASAAGLPAAIHAIGDRAVREVLNVYEALRQEEAARGLRPDQRRHRIEHVQLIHPEDAGRLGELGVIASMQPIHATSDRHMADAYWGDRADYAYNWRLQAEAGAVLAFGSDAPVEAIEPLPNLHAAVTRRSVDGSPGPEGWRSGKGGRLSVEEALRGFTLGPAYAAGMEDRLGRLAPAYLADLVVLGQNIYACDPMDIYKTDVLGTMVNGAWVFRDF